MFRGFGESAAPNASSSSPEMSALKRVSSYTRIVFASFSPGDAHRPANADADIVD